MVPTASSITYIGDAAGRPKSKSLWCFFVVTVECSEIQ